MLSVLTDCVPSHIRFLLGNSVTQPSAQRFRDLLEPIPFCNTKRTFNFDHILDLSSTLPAEALPSKVLQQRWTAGF